MGGRGKGWCRADQSAFFVELLKKRDNKKNVRFLKYSESPFVEETLVT